MIGKFYESFGKEREETQELPMEVIDILNAQLPKNFMYSRDESGHYRAVPRPERVSKGIKITTQICIDQVKDADVLEKLGKIPQSKWAEYFYRTQMRVPIKNAKIGDEEKVIPIEELSRDPLSDEEVSLTDGFIQSYTFPKPFIIIFESPEGDKAVINFQQQAYDSLTEIKYMNTDFTALKIELYQYSPLAENYSEEAHTNVNNQLVVNYSVTPSKADSVKDAVTALHIFKGLFKGTTKVNGHTIPPRGGDRRFDPKKVEDALLFWETASLLEGKLNVRFDPKDDCPEEDIRFLTELKTCLLDGKAIVWRHPFEHFHVEDLPMTQEERTFEDVIGKDSIRYKFMEGPIPATLLGAKFDLYSITEMRDFIVTNIEYDDKEKKAADIYISDAPDKQWTLVRFYLTSDDKEEYKMLSDEF